MHNELKLGIRCDFLPKDLIRLHILIADMASGKTDDGASDSAKYLTFEIAEFGADVIANKTVSFGDILHSDYNHADAKAIDMVTSLLPGIAFNFCRRVIFNVTSSGVYCSVMLDNHQILRANNDYRWKTEGEMLEYFFLQS